MTEADERVRRTAVELIHVMVQIERNELEQKRIRKQLQEAERHYQKLVREAQTRERLIAQANATR